MLFYHALNIRSMMENAKQRYFASHPNYTVSRICVLKYTTVM